MIIKKNTKGFTLIELLVVVAIISLLSSIVLASVDAARVRARDARRKTDFYTLQNALELYHLDHGEYPQIVRNHSNSDQRAFCASDWTCWSPGGVFYNMMQPYISELPQDPKPVFNPSNYGAHFYYVYQFLGRDSYCLAGTLENSSDSLTHARFETCHTTTTGSPSRWPNFSILVE